MPQSNSSGGLLKRIRAAITGRLNARKARKFGQSDARIFDAPDGLRFLVYPDSAMDFTIATQGTYDRPLVELMRRLVPEDGTLFDVGANIGLLCTALAKYVTPRGQIHAFEPDVDNFAQLATNLRLNRLRSVRLNLLAVQDDPATTHVTLYQREETDHAGLRNTGMYSIEQMPAQAALVRAANRVPATTLDEYAASAGVSRLDLIKIDVEGAEARVLRGGRKLIERFQPSIVYEYSTVIDQMTGISSSAQSFAMLSELGYRQFKIHHDGTGFSELRGGESGLELINVLAAPKGKEPA